MTGPDGSRVGGIVFEIVDHLRRRMLVPIATALHAQPIVLPAVLVVDIEIASAMVAPAKYVPSHCKLRGSHEGPSTP